MCSFVQMIAAESSFKVLNVLLREKIIKGEKHRVLLCQAEDVSVLICRMKLFKFITKTVFFNVKQMVKSKVMWILNVRRTHMDFNFNFFRQRVNTIIGFVGVNQLNYFFLRFFHKQMSSLIHISCMWSTRI